MKGRSMLAVAAALPLALLGAMLGSDSPRPAPVPGSALAPGSVPPPFQQWVVRAGALCPEIPPTAIAAQLDAESGWNPTAQSGAGARGLAQFMPTTWPTWGRDDDGSGSADPDDPADAIMAQGRYMCALGDQMRQALNHNAVQGDVLDLALAGYNAGAGAVLSAGGIPTNGQTEKYVPKIRQLMGRYGAIGPNLASGPFAEREIAAASAFINRAPYVWGGGTINGPSAGATPGIGFDCSGLVLYALYQASGGKITAQRPADHQATLGQPVARGQEQRGDVIAFTEPGQSQVHHIGIYLGGGKLLHAPDFGQTVTVSDLGSAYWQHQTWNIRRFG